MRPGDYVIFPTGDHITYIWKISGVYYGADGHEDVVGLKSVSRNPAVAHGSDVEEMMVPIALVHDHVFTSAIRNDVLKGWPRDDADS